MAKYKYLRGGRVFESDKKYNLPQIGPDGKLVTPSKAKVDLLKKTVKESVPNYDKQQWLNPEREWFGGATNKGKAGELYITDAGNLEKNPTFNKDNRLIKPIPIKADKTAIAKPVYATGGYVDTATSGMSGFMEQNPNLSAKKPKRPNNFNLGNFLGQAAPFMDNIGNLIATAKTPAIPDPILTPPPRLASKLNVNPQLRRVENDARATNMAIGQTTGNVAVANANKGSVLANKFRAVGDIEANKVNAETQMGNRAAYADYEGRSRNDQLVNQRNTMNMMRTDDINSRYAGVIGNFGDDIANINREKNLMARDKEAMSLLMKTNPDASYQFADTKTFKDLYKNDEPALRRLILSQKGSAQKAKLQSLYRELFNQDFTD